MYKVFINEKKLSLSNLPIEGIRNLAYKDSTTIEIGVDLLENTSCLELNIHAENLEKLWTEFRNLFKIIEAAGGIVRNDKAEILFIYRLERWDLPKGKIEANESLEQAAVREIQEETSLKSVDLQEFIDSTYHIYKDRGGKHILKVTHWFKMFHTGTEQPMPQIEEGISKVDWKSEKAIREEVLPSTFQNIVLILGEYGIR